MGDLSTVVALVISGMALAISTITAWLTFFQRGTLKMTRPNMIFFGYDTTPGRPDPKVFLRALLYSTSKRGQLIENLYLRLTRGETVQNFPDWFHGEVRNLSVGGGLFVGQDGIAVNHHFVLSPEQSKFAFQTGDYILQVFGNVVGNSRALLLFETELSISPENAKSLENVDTGLHFTWGPESKKYYARADKRPERIPPQEWLAMVTRHGEENTDKEVQQ